MSKRRLGRISVSVVAVGALVVVAAACGGSSAAKSSTTSTTAAGGGGANRVAFEAYRTCLSQHGVTLPQRRQSTGGPPPSGSGAGGLAGEGGFGGGGFGGGSGGATPQSLPKGVTAAEFAAAQTACRSKLPAGGLFGGGQGGQAFQAYTSCLRDHGVTIASVAPQTTVAGSPRPTFNRNDPKFVAANKVCAALLPSRTTTTTAG
jgi:hypothetical protein